MSWAIGIFEGAGSIVSMNETRQRRLQIKTTDEEIARRYAEIVGSRLLGPYGRNDPTRRPYWMVQINGTEADIVLGLWFPFLSERRQAKAVEVGFDPSGVLERARERSGGDGQNSGRFSGTPSRLG
jgi:hypothetical protein